MIERRSYVRTVTNVAEWDTKRDIWRIKGTTRQAGNQYRDHRRTWTAETGLTTGRQWTRYRKAVQRLARHNSSLA